MKIVTSCQTPDLDGVACMYAYSELLNIQGEEANYFINGESRTEVHIVCEKFNIELNGIKAEDISDLSEFVLVDCNGLGYLYNKIKPNNIVKVIDHHSLSDSLASYTHIQRCQIDRIGATATIVTERFKNSRITPSRESAILLFYAIISNSINLKATITKQRDIDACKWLECLYDDITYEIIKEIFEEKSKINEMDLRSEMECEFPLVLDKFKVIVGQLEIANLETFIKKNKEKIIEILKKVKNEKKLDYAFINCVDILYGYVIIISADDESQNFVEKTFGYIFDEKNIAKINKIVQRKEMTAIIRQKYKN